MVSMRPDAEAHVVSGALSVLNPWDYKTLNECSFEERATYLRSMVRKYRTQLLLPSDGTAVPPCWATVGFVFEFLGMTPESMDALEAPLLEKLREGKRKWDAEHPAP